VFKKILIANRGEIALRILRACRELGIEAVAVHSTADARAMHVRLADESVCIGPPSSAESYLNKASILAAAEVAGADAVHPGYGFLSENAAFAAMVEDHGLAFIGPTPEHIRTMGDKIAAKRAAVELGLPVVPGSAGALGALEDAARAAREVGYPVLVKAVSGGGGRGMLVVWSEADLAEAYRTARQEALKAFGDDRVYLEKYMDHPRHIEVQVLGDGRGGAVHLGERDCTLQRRHQKVLEEAPAPVLSVARRQEIGERVAAAMRKLGYRGAGTVEFLYQDGAFAFIEMNTRLQVEHPVTEAVTGIDLVCEQIRIAAGAPFRLRQEEVRLDGHAIELRITAEDPDTLAPRPGKVIAYHAPGGPGIRVDSALYAGAVVPPHYDSLIAKLVAFGPDRTTCVRRLLRSLDEYVIEGCGSTIPLLKDILRAEDVQANRYDTGWLGRFLDARREGT
jgi:acetyl-CoA carboxylase biotin carboxylase subunit